MAKKSVKKKVVKKKTVAKKKVARKSTPKKVAAKPLKRKIGIAVKNLIFFTILFVISLVLYSVSNEDIYTNLFIILSILFGFIALAFLLVYLIFFFMKVMGK